MLINEGKYIGTGVYRLDKDKSTQQIECTLEISIKPNAYEMRGYWQTYSRKKKYEFCVNIDKFTSSKIDNVIVRYMDVDLAGALNSIGEYATGVFSTKDRIILLGTTVLTLKNGYRVSGIIMANEKVMFDVKLMSNDPSLANSNVVDIVGKSA